MCQTTGYALTFIKLNNALLTPRHTVLPACLLRPLKPLGFKGAVSRPSLTVSSTLKDRLGSEWGYLLNTLLLPAWLSVTLPRRGDLCSADECYFPKDIKMYPGHGENPPERGNIFRRCWILTGCRVGKAERAYLAELCGSSGTAAREACCLGCQSGPGGLVSLPGYQCTRCPERSPGSHLAACLLQSDLSSLVVLRRQEVCPGRAKLLQLKDQRPALVKRQSHLLFCPCHSFLYNGWKDLCFEGAFPSLLKRASCAPTQNPSTSAHAI